MKLCVYEEQLGTSAEATWATGTPEIEECCGENLKLHNFKAWHFWKIKYFLFSCLLSFFGCPKQQTQFFLLGTNDV